MNLNTWNKYSDFRKFICDPNLLVNEDTVEYESNEMYEACPTEKIPTKVEIRNYYFIKIEIPSIEYKQDETISVETSIEEDILLELEKLEDIAKELEDHFDDMDILDKQILLYNFKSKLDELWRQCEDKEFRKAILRLEGAIKNLKSENLTKKQATALRKSIELLIEKGGNSKHEILKILLDAGIFTLPKIEDLSSEYVNE